jgi:hypothetical protein
MKCRSFTAHIRISFFRIYTEYISERSFRGTPYHNYKEESTVFKGKEAGASMIGYKTISRIKSNYTIQVVEYRLYSKNLCNYSVNVRFSYPYLENGDRHVAPLLAMTVTVSVIASDSEAISVLLKLRSNFAL